MWLVTAYAGEVAVPAMVLHSACILARLVTVLTPLTRSPVIVEVVSYKEFLDEVRRDV